jgi:hypothetical protein
MEEWKEIIGYSDYQVSNLGNVKSLNFNKTKKEKLLKPIICNKYPSVCLWNQDGKSLKTIHRLVAESFIANPNHYLTVDHINRNKMDNRVENLQWAPYSEQNKNKNNWHRGTNTGERYITKIDYGFLVQKSVNQIRNVKYFRIIEEAIQYRNTLLNIST